MSIIYEVVSVQARQGKQDGAGASIVGRKVHVSGVGLGSSMHLFETDSDKYLRTSRIEAFNSDWQESGYLSVQTRNTVYTLRKVVE